MFQGVSANLFIYLTTKLHQGIVTASNNVTNWNGAIWIMPIFGAYIADAHLGRYRTFLISSFIWFTVCSYELLWYNFYEDEDLTSLPSFGIEKMML